MCSRRSTTIRAHKNDPSAAVPLLDSNALSVLLQHPSMQTVRITCALLCTSKAFAGPIAEYMHGQLAIAGNMQQQGQQTFQPRPDFVQWLEGNACLVKSLDLQYYPAHSPSCSGLASVAAALKRAARTAAPHCGLVMQSYQATATSMPLLQQMPSSLTRLHPGTLVYAELDDHISAPQRALARLTNLKEAVLQDPDSSTLLPAFSALKRLTSLGLQQLSVEGVSNFKHLPAQLQSLTFSANLVLGRNDELQSVAVSLEHVTGLTSLVCERCNDGTTFDLQQQDVLPPSLCQLALSSVEYVEPLLQLQHLQRLQLWAVDVTPPDVLRQLTRLASLTELQLGYWVHNSEDIYAHIDVWPLLPLRALDIYWLDEEYMELALLQQLPKCTGLTRLLLQIEEDEAAPGKYGVEATPQEFASVVGQLTALQELHLIGACCWAMAIDLMDPGQVVFAVMQLFHVLRAVAALPQLRVLGLRRLDDKAMCFNFSAVEQLARLTQLTQLTLEGDFAKPALRAVSRLTGLQNLWMNYPASVTAPHLASIARALTQLKSIAYQVEDFAAAKHMWAFRHDVCVKHITKHDPWQPSGDTVDVFM